MMNTAQAETDVLALLDDMATRTANAPQARQDFAREWVRIQAELIRSVVLSGAAPVATTGTATAQTGTATLTTVRLT